MTRGLTDIPFLHDASPEALAHAEAAAEWFSLPGGWPLFHAGEPPDGLYFVLSGSLAAFRGGDGDQKLVGYIRAGEPVGEMALIADDGHTGSVYAIRDTELVRFPRAAFERLIDLHPQLMRNLARLMLRRNREGGRKNARAEPKVYALIATSPTIDLRLRARTLVDAMARLGKNVCVIGEEADDMLSEWFDDLEHDHDAVFLVSPIADTSWFRTCLRQADRVWILARSDAVPSIPLLPDDHASPTRRFQLVDIVLLHHGADRQAASTEQWRRACDAARIFHWRGLDDADAQRLARVVAGQAMGLVLSGGGARAYAHLGVVRALREAKLPIDIVGGTSMGAIVAACYAMGWDDNEMETRIRKAFVESNPLGDYVLPVVALSRGRRVEHRLEEHFGATLIEDLRVPFFCVSTNLVTAAAQVHRAGRLRDALRASISLPGILPPVVDGPHGLLVDGAVVMNFPVDVMKELHRGPIVGVDVARKSTIDPQDYADAPDFISWVTRRGFQAAPPIASLLMHTATLGVDPWVGRDGADVLVTPDMPDVDLRDWKKFDSAVAAGYEAAVAALRKRSEDATAAAAAPADAADWGPAHAPGLAVDAA
ncbi:MAG: patatin-like phospholipase family protein [Hyphomonadaceae bacterium]|nr:patatin-like phospholipase family protein [Hyphomonadaceae bacterium]